MSKTIQFNGEFVIEDDEFDPGPEGPLTEKAFAHYNRKFKGFKNRFYVALDDDGSEVGEGNAKRKKAKAPGPVSDQAVIAEALGEAPSVEAAEAAASEAAAAAYEAEIAEFVDSDDDSVPFVDPALEEAPVEVVPEPVAVEPSPVPAPEPAPVPVEAPPVAAPATDIVPPPLPAPVIVEDAPPSSPVPPSMPSPAQMFAAPAEPAVAPDPDFPDDSVPF